MYVLLLCAVGKLRVLKRCKDIGEINLKMCHHHV